MTVQRIGFAAWWFLRPFVLLIGVLALIWLFAASGISLGWIVLGLLLWVLPVFVGYRLTLSKDSPWPLGLSLFLGWVGVLFALAIPDHGKRCPACDEKVRQAATVCRYCGTALD